MAGGLLVELMDMVRTLLRYYMLSIAERGIY